MQVSSSFVLIIHRIKNPKTTVLQSVLATVPCQILLLKQSGLNPYIQFLSHCNGIYLHKTKVDLATLLKINSPKRAFYNWTLKKKKVFSQLNLKKKVFANKVSKKGFSQISIPKKDHLTIKCSKKVFSKISVPKEAFFK